MLGMRKSGRMKKVPIKIDFKSEGDLVERLLVLEIIAISGCTENSSCIVTVGAVGKFRSLLLITFLISPSFSC
jgi:hypothetical protein